MKTIKTNKPLLLIFNPCLLIIGMLIFCHWTTAFQPIFYLFWLPLFCLLFLMLSPLGKKRLGEPSTMSWQTWFCAIAGLQLVLLLSFIGIGLLCGHIFLINTLSHPRLISDTLKTFLVKEGLFPWSIYAVFAVGYGYTAFSRKKNAYTSTMLLPIKKTHEQSTLSLIINIGMRRCVIFTLSTLAVFTALLFMNLLLPINIHLSYGFHTATILTTLALLALSYADFVKLHLFKLFARTIPTYLSLPVFCIGLAVITLILNFMISGMYQKLPSTPLNPLATAWIHYDWMQGWSLFSTMWFICLTPLVSIVIARISRGFQIRQILIGTLILPIIIALLFYADLPFHYFHFSTEILSGFSVIALLLLLPLLLNHRRLTDAQYAYLPQEGLSKHRYYHSFIVEIMRHAIFVLLLFLTIGVNGLAFLFFTFNFLNIIVLPVGCVCIAIYLMTLKTD